ncbi:GIY-YIG nuclease family protein [Candidatus Spongiihabitans sp.]|uniref:GIY-YIG nuclease family protein n=1 Tax=Candidatus Spongiihabitans sp. TaxID=3101308 RepID=UPI003C7CE326
MSGKKSGSFDKSGIENLAKNKPVVYQIVGKDGKTLYIGSAKRGRVPERLTEHLSGNKDPIPGGKRVKIQQAPSIDAARKSEARMIKLKQPPRNKQGK